MQSYCIVTDYSLFTWFYYSNYRTNHRQNCQHYKIWFVLNVSAISTCY